ncbi:MAG: pyruvate kinase [Candidatus Omnitrophica bacterium]|nr:pyruvate kinase [Candidatus Omnitrophota bacterium]
MIPKTKIIATLGPASSSYTVLRKMVLAGLDVVRINFSHGKSEEYLERIRLVRKINEKYRRAVKLLGDLQGYRIRIDKLKKPVELKKRKIIYFTQKDIVGEDNIIPFDYKGSLRDIKKGSFIYIDDGRLCLVAQGFRGKLLKAEVLTGGLLLEHKGVNIPELKLSFKGLSLKDRTDIQFCLDYNFEYLAQSFVRDKSDLLKIKELIPEKSNIKLIAKIESSVAIKNLEKILDECDGVMVARGDLGVSCPIHEVAILQKEIIKRARVKKRFVITATQMLESMTEQIRPTRAEVSDITNAILDGSDFLMLSAETAVGRYPVEAVRMMNQIIKATERYLKR